MTALSVFVGILGAQIVWIILSGIVLCVALRSKRFIRGYVRTIKRIAETAEEIEEEEDLF